MNQGCARWLLPMVAAGIVLSLSPPGAKAACCYFSAKDKDIEQPGQKVFITWNAKKREECFTVQPKFKGNAQDFGMVIPTPGRPKLDAMPRGFFKELAVYTILKQRQFPQSTLLPPQGFGGGIAGIGGLGGLGGMMGFGGGLVGTMPKQWRKPAVKVVESGVVGSLDYKIIKAGRADDLFKWLKANKYRYSGDEATLGFYVKKKWYFTVMKIDTMQMKRNKDGSYTGEVTPTRFQFASNKLIYPLKITQLSVKDKTEALFYVQTAHKVDLPGDLTYQFQWVPMLQNARGWYAKGIFGRGNLPGKGSEWLKAIGNQEKALLQNAKRLGFDFVTGQRPEPNKKGHVATTLEWAKRLTRRDINLLRVEALFSERVPDVDKGFSAADVKDKKRAKAVYAIIQSRLHKSHKIRPGGYLVREAPAKDISDLKILAGHLEEGQFLTKFRKSFAVDEMNDDLVMVPARMGRAEDKSEYEEVLPTSPP
jgi:hypothetical protein